MGHNSQVNIKCVSVHLIWTPHQSKGNVCVVAQEEDRLKRFIYQRPVTKWLLYRRSRGGGTVG